MSEITGASEQTLANAPTDDIDHRDDAVDEAASVRQLPSFEAFFRRHERDIFGYLWRMTGDEQAAYDLSQETFVRAWQHFDRIASYERPGGWLFRVATNLALTHQKRAAAPVGAAQPFSPANDPATSDPSWRLAESEAIRATLLALAPQQRAALVLREVCGFSCAEVAEALGITLAAAKMTLSRGRDAFRALHPRGAAIMSLTGNTSQPTAPTCALGLTSADLSAWRDEALAPDATARIGAHSATCPACQQRLRGFEAIAATLQAQRVPAPDERLWQAVLAALSTGQRTTNDDSITGEYRVPDESDDRNPLPQSPTSPRSWRRRALGTLAAVAAIALVVVGFGRLFQFGAQNRPSQTFSLTWRQMTLPGGMGKNLTEGTALSVFPANGSVAWICQSGTEAAPGPLRIWRTTDAGTTWRSVEAPQLTRAFDCQIQLDQLNPNVAVLDLDAFVHPPQSQAQHATYITFDGGASWENDPLTLPMSEFATANGTTYAIRQDETHASHLMVGILTPYQHDWVPVDDVLYARGGQPTRFWLNPATGGLLVQAASLRGDGAMSLTTADLSANVWLRVKVGASPIGETAAIPTGDGHWSICTLADGVSANPDFRGHVYCGTDTTSWSERPSLDILGSDKATPTSCGDCGAMTLLGMANDGAVLVTADDRFDAKGQATRTSLYRLPAGSNTWQNGGALPITASTFGAARLSSTVIFTPRPGGGMLWAMPDQDIGTHPAGPVYTASYPGSAAPPLPTWVQQMSTPAGNVDQGAPLAWQPIATPAGFQPRLTSANILAVAPSDGRTAYACAQPNADPPPAPLRGWVTHDGGATWTSLALPRVAGWCSLVVDEVNPRDVLLGFSHNPPAGGTTVPDLYYRSTDGGATWQGIPGMDGSLVYQFASYRGAVYALRNATPGSLGSSARVQVSTDGMIGWRTVDDAFFSSDNTAAQFWLDPYNGELLVSNIAGPLYGIPLSSATTAIFLHSNDGGTHWRSLGTPPIQPGGASSVLVQPPQANHAWGVCVANTSDTTVTLKCGDDSDQGWHRMPALDVGSATSLPRYTAYTSDGAILAVVTTTLGNSANTYNVYRLSAGAQRWQALGATPEFSLLYAPTTEADGMLWSVPTPGIVADEQGRVFAVAAP